MGEKRYLFFAYKRQFFADDTGKQTVYYNIIKKYVEIA